jgi:hypothetical protein
MKPITIALALLAVVGLVVLGATPAVSAPPTVSIIKETMEEVGEGDNKSKMLIRYNETKKELDGVTLSGPEGTTAYGTVGQLKIKDEGGEEHTITIEHSEKGTIITTSSPECKWYFFGGQWWRICQ